ncbi:origin recognition complex subunit 3 N-terminus-domain-containing protein [Massariosphaeria phaeospora]|uniref:Origin recognition complex subunit 3 N-terminus-domain-containing protein n=1 Tax=Massariosphaeria phaeospora TaxID=100035 RepID=A0A7C8IBY0_9PLEO|nr:origin recognition complex subunit 3 N-terminus-domain-containing protein [Massariosphaeria phaeospora]
MEHQRCYIYSPTEPEERARKRQRTSKPHFQAQLPERLQTFRDMWSHQEERIQETLEDADSSTQEAIANFVSASSQDTEDLSLAIPTALIILGPSIASHGPFFERLGRRIKHDTNNIYVVLTSGESPNLKTLLKNLIKKVTSRVDDDDDDDEMRRPLATSRNGPKLLDFDLGHLQEWQKRNRAQNIVLAIQDSNAFDASVLIELVDLLHSWLDRLPFVLLVGIATSAENLEDRLAGKTLRYLQGQKFDVTQPDEIIEKLFSATVARPDARLRIGPNISQRILKRQRDHVQNVQDFVDALKYAYMSHFYANQMSIFLKDGISFEDLSSDDVEVARTLPSFRSRVEQLLDESRVQEVRKLLDDDYHTFRVLTEAIASGQNALSSLNAAATILSRVRQALQMSPEVMCSTIWTRAAAGEIIGSPFLRETMLLVRRVPSDKFAQLLNALEHSEGDFVIDPRPYKQELEQLLEQNPDSTPLRTQHDVRNDSVRTTVVAQKVLLSKHKAALSKQDKAYSELVGRFHDEMECFFSSAFINPQTLLLSEVLIYDLKSPHTEVFQPKPRYAIERALALPHDYLGCDCCSGVAGKGEGSALSGTQPASAILYQMYLESGALINVSDLWSAFHAIAGEGEEEEDGESKTMQRGLAELKYLGLVKPSRKKTDHIAKTMWKGL